MAQAPRSETSCSRLAPLLLQDTFDQLFNIASSGVEGTLYRIKQKFWFNPVSSDVSSCFNHAIDLLHFATEGHVCALAELFTNEKGLNVKSMSSDEKTILVSDIADDLIEEIFVHSNVKQVINVDQCRSM